MEIILSIEEGSEVGVLHRSYVRVVLYHPINIAGKQIVCVHIERQELSSRVKFIVSSGTLFAAGSRI